METRLSTASYRQKKHELDSRRASRRVTALTRNSMETKNETNWNHHYDSAFSGARDRRSGGRVAGQAGQTTRKG
jgi:hypothetical protein